MLWTAWPIAHDARAGAGDRPRMTRMTRREIQALRSIR
ncbi:hypothetical protein PATSB16_36890 [Pandoraea thiooxydans]|nr:hypothetical protein PATSB16_36890 [Pandoraea thiooxydans]